MSHDLVAELNGLRTERVNLTAAGKTERVKLIDEHIDRVRAEVREQADELETAAQALDETGQDLLAAERRVRARTLLEAAGEDEPPARSGRSGRGGRGSRGSSVTPAPGAADTATPPAAQTAADTTPTEKAVTAAPAAE